MTSLPRRIDLLLVDDDPAITEALDFALRGDFDIRQVHDVVSALIAVELRRPDVIVSDLEMDRADDGQALLRAVEQLHPSVRRVVYSAHPQFQLDAIVASGYAHAAIVKSGDAGCLVTVIRDLLSTPANGVQADS